jgi:peptidoglycan/xylan/chitin deacetylase (PgdA/CDA1 family)
VARALVLALAFASVVALAFALAMPMDLGSEPMGQGPGGLAAGSAPQPPAGAGPGDAGPGDAGGPGPAVGSDAVAGGGAEAMIVGTNDGTIAAGRGRGASVVILDYHTFLGKKGDNLDFSATELASQLDAMSALGYRFVSLEDAIAGRIAGRANIAITIDDGNHSVYGACREVLLPRGIRPTLFIYPAIVLSRLSYALAPEELAGLMCDGCIIGAHGYNHNPLSDKAWEKSRKSYWNEIALPAQAIAGITGSVPVIFAYPFGKASARAEKDLAEADYEWAFTADADFGPVDFDAPDLDHMAVHRTIVYRWNYPKILKALADHLKD